ncbi:hypothetical protein QNN65_14445 [Listeria monocytogenes]|uniref:hypothetical protein n=1 Tax=Listeria monocytogenes TaxID=1639 RepID=UPI0024BEBAE6|nr:hypothetical protein [Listeria monocytogenes]MDJ1596141.1 hypothetical protein [Listeria monocytogenes]
MSKFTKLMQGYLHLIEGKMKKSNQSCWKQNLTLQLIQSLKPLLGYGLAVKSTIMIEKK